MIENPFAASKAAKRAVAIDAEHKIGSDSFGAFDRTRSAALLRGRTKSTLVLLRAAGRAYTASVSSFQDMAAASPRRAPVSSRNFTKHPMPPGWLLSTPL
jgi:hypothetical protein